jgi:predicted DNA binding CopG/RHH family protein
MSSQPDGQPHLGHMLDDEERDIIAAIGRDDYKPVSLLTEQSRQVYRAAARATINEPRVKISLRLPESDLARLKARALREGMPYQTLINAILHKAVG